MITLDTLENHCDAIKDPLKKRAWNAFQTIGLPTQKWEAFRYFPLKALYNTHFNFASNKQLLEENIKDRAVAIFINGRYCPRSSYLPSTIVAKPLKEAFGLYGPLLKKRFEKSVAKEVNPFVFLNNALYEEGLFLYVAPHQKLKTPLELVFIQTDATVASSPKIELFLGKESELTLLSSSIQKEKIEAWSNSAMHITLEEGSKLTHVNDTSGVKTGMSLQALRAELKKESMLKNFVFSASASPLRHDLQVFLTGESAQAELNGLHLTKEKGQAHTHILVQHAAPHTQSFQRYKAIVENRAKAHFCGKIYVEKEAQKTDAYQLNNMLLLGKNAKGMSQPQLEIFADDVKASHGATCARPSAEEVFYLRARGLSASDANEQLVKAFCKELIEDHVYAPLKKHFKGLIEEFLQKGR